MKKSGIVLLITFILAFCSIVYELLLAQLLSAFLANTVLRYSVTIGLYMFSMGFGAMIAEGRFVIHPVLTLLKIEILLTIIGGGAVTIMHALNMLGMPVALFSALAHTLIIVIGILTGFEIPLLIEIYNKEKAENLILGIDYSGALLGTIIFAFIFYPRLGLVPTGFLVGLINAFAGSMLITQHKMITKQKKKWFQSALYCQALLMIIILFCLINSEKINGFFLSHYLRS